MKIKKIFKKLFSTLMLFLLVFSFTACGDNADDEETLTSLENYAAYAEEELKSIIDYYLDNYNTENGTTATTLDELDLYKEFTSYYDDSTYFAFDNDLIRFSTYAAAIDYKIDESEFEKNLKSEIETQYADYDALCAASPSQINVFAEAVEAIGGEAQDFADYNLAAAGSYDSTYYMYDAYDYAYAISNSCYTTMGSEYVYSSQDLVEMATDSVYDTGAWGYADWTTGDETSDIDYTSSMVMALIQIDSSNEFDLTEYIDNGMDYILSKQNDDGTFASAWSTDSSSSSAWAVCTLIAYDEKEFNDGGDYDFATNNIVEMLADAYAIDGGGYGSSLESEYADSFSVMDMARLFYTVTELD